MKKSVLFLARLYAPHVGGVEKHLAKLCQELQKRNYSCQVITEQFDSSLPLEESIDQVKVIRIPQTALNSKLKLWWWILQKKTLFFDADVIHIHDVFWWQLPLSIFLKKKSFMTFHGYEGSEPPKMNQLFWHQLAEKMTSGNICIGGFHQKWYGVTPTITSFGAANPTPKKASKSKRKPNSIIFLGRLAEDTGIMTYLAGLKQLVKKNPNWKLDVFGAGPQLAAAQKYARQNKLPATFHGFVENAAQLLPTYSVAFISRHLAILESLAAETPIVAHYNNDIKKDYLELSPFKESVSIANTPEEISRAVQLIKPVSTSAKKWVQEQTWVKMADNYQRLWRHH